jgi:murein DD-endopeptidase MepM/ murein hydrolase activator NlpD
MITFAALLWIGMIAALLLSDLTSQTAVAQSPQGAQTAAAVLAATQAEPPALPPQEVPIVEPQPAPLLPATALSGSPEAVAAPYTDYTVSQGPHGFSYGHAAIDLTAGNGATILSPINGSVTQNFVDYLGNTTLVIENEVYQVTLMHGNYYVAVGEALSIGQMIGTESNNGNTVDWWGRSCQGRDCGYHTHWNMFDKRLGSNVNPLTLIP